MNSTQNYSNMCFFKIFKKIGGILKTLLKNPSILCLNFTILIIKWFQLDGSPLTKTLLGTCDNALYDTICPAFVASIGSEVIINLSIDFEVDAILDKQDSKWYIQRNTLFCARCSVYWLKSPSAHQFDLLQPSIQPNFSNHEIIWQLTTRQSYSALQSLQISFSNELG